MYKVDLNCDMGESFGRYTIGVDKDILQYVTSANVACGFHAGDPLVMKSVVQLARHHNVAIGAHPGLPDLVGFGRRNMDITPNEAFAMIMYQIGALDAFCRAEQVQMQHVKPHGALYNMAAKNASLAQAIAAAVYQVNPKLVLYGLSGSELIKAGQAQGLQTASEVFADRTYQADGSLTPRKQADAMITDDDAAVQQVIRMVKEGIVKSQQGEDIAIQADTICIHGDGAHALEFAVKIRDGLKAAGVRVERITA